MKIIKQLTALMLVYLIIINSLLTSLAADANSLSEVKLSSGSFQTEDIKENEKKCTDDLYYFVIYSYNGQSYNVNSNNVARLSDIFRELIIPYDIDDVANVSVSDSDILKLTKVDSDWELVAPGSFGSEQTLTVVLKNGESIEITVKDPIIYNYAVGASATNVALGATETRVITNITDAGNNVFSGFIGSSFKSNSQNIANPTGSGSVDVIIYATPGMAVRFAGSNGSWSSKPGNTGSAIWYWFWGMSRPSNSSAEEYSNFAILKEGTEGQYVKFSYKVNGTNLTVNVTLCSVATFTEMEGTDKQANLLEGAGNLPEGYSIKSLPITLYDYDGLEFNKNYEKLGGNYFAFHGNSQGVNAKNGLSNFGWNSTAIDNKGVNSSGDTALMGIVREDLVDGLPVMSQGHNVDLFSSKQINGKTVYENVKFQFVYNESTGYYTYNSSLNHAQYNSSNNTVELYKQSLAPSDTAISNIEGKKQGNAGFYPFANINNSYTNPGYKQLSMQEWANKLASGFTLEQAQYSTGIVHTESDNPASSVNMHFGLQLACDFYLPEGKQLNGQDMIFNFTGDDDLWVFVDDKLVLDIGGGHTEISGSFNLTTGEVYVKRYAQLSAAQGGYYPTYKWDGGVALRQTSSYLQNLQGDQMHNIKVFYLERHSGVSNCYLHFNLPVIPSNSVSVSKDLVNHEGAELSVTPDVEYTFTIYTAEDTDDNGDANDFNIYVNAPYTLTGDGAPTELQYTNSNGQFKLKNGWMARFLDIPRFTNVYIIESTPNDGYIYTQSTVSVNREAATAYTYGNKTVTMVIQSNMSVEFAFVNYIKTQALTIEKQVINGTQGLINPDQEFEFKLDFTKDIVETGKNEISATDKSGGNVELTDNGTFRMGHNESITIPRVPVNMTFTLQEANPDVQNGSFDAPIFVYENCTTQDTPNAFDTDFTWTVGNNGNNRLIVKNQQRFNLTISKAGISNVDHNNNEQQSTIYTLVGKIGDDEIVRLNVAICGNDEITVCRLPVGVYTVEENTDWSWRYDVVDGALKIVAIQTNAQASVAYENQRAKNFWSSGDCYVENWFSADGIKKRNGDDEVTV